MENMTLADIAAVTGKEDFGCNSWVLIILFALIFGSGNGGLFGGRNNDASAQEILFGQHFQDLDNKIDRVANGIADATFSLNNSITNEGRNLQTNLSNYQLSTQKQMDDMRLEMANGFCSVKSTCTENTQKVLDALAQSKIEALQARVNQLEMQQYRGGCCTGSI